MEQVFKLEPREDDEVLVEREPRQFCSATPYCDPEPNSVGPGGRLSTNDELSIAANQFVLHAEGCPPGHLGFFLYGPDQVVVPFGNGTLCVGGFSRLLPVAHLDTQGETSYPVDFDGLGANPITAGTPVNFQLWYRDPDAGGLLFNATEAVHVDFCP